MDNSMQSMMFMIMSLSKNTDQSYTSMITMIVMICLPHFIKYINEVKFSDMLFKSKKITLVIKSYKVPILRLSCTNQFKTTFSESFLAIIYYINMKKRNNLTSLTEIMTNNDELNCYVQQDVKKTKNDFVYIPINNKNIQIDDHIFCDIDLKIVNEASDDKSNDSHETKEYTITLSTNVNIALLEKFVDQCVTEHNLILNKSMIYEGKPYIYEYKSFEKNEYTNDYKLCYTESLMEHNKNIETNIFIEDKDKLIQYITPFIYDPNETINKAEEEYNKCGFTFKAGLFFYGSPGCGKTSTIKAILKYTNRNGIIINLNKVKTCDELKAIFRNRVYNKRNHPGKQLCFILEDCDAFDNNILLNRSVKDYKKEKNNVSDEISELKNIMLLNSQKSDVTIIQSGDDNDKLNLSCFLNILDGIIELYGVMIIMTTNHPEVIDSALIRPGRFDFKYEFKKSSKKIIKEMIQFKYGLTKKDMLKYTQLNQINDEVLSPAQVQSVCFKNQNVDNCITELFSLIQ